VETDVVEALRTVTVLATNYDGSLHWTHSATLLQAADHKGTTQTLPDTRVTTESGFYISPFETLAHYWQDRWFNVIRLETPGEGLYGYYCNVATPVDFDGETVHYVDLQLDVRVFADAAGALEHRLVDEDDFEAARERYGYPDELVACCRAAVKQLIAMIEAREFPFDA
jgi:uncharacterized protein